jgi:hypothetical protein
MPKRVNSLGRQGAFLAPVPLLILGLLLTGCSANDSGPQLDLPEKNITQAVMPLDQYMQPISDKVPYARALLIQPCMDSAGFQRSVPWQDISKLDQPLRRSFTSEVARTYGYHSPKVIDPTVEAWTTYSFKQFSPSEQTAFDKCFTSIEDKLPELTPQEMNLAAGMTSNSYESSFQDPKVIASAKAWHTCMQPQGIIDLPETPRKMPTPSMVKQFGLDAGSDSEPTAVPTKASPKEQALASADVDCREKSGYGKALYDTEWNLQVKLIQKNGAALQRVEARMHKLDKIVDTIITEHAPKS